MGLFIGDNSSSYLTRLTLPLYPGGTPWDSPQTFPKVQSNGKIMECTVTKKIRTLKGGWKQADAEDEAKYPQYVSERKARLVIEGNPKNGNHLIMTPEGCFAADTHYSTIEDAMADAREAFGVSDEGWNPVGCE